MDQYLTSLTKSDMKHKSLFGYTWCGEIKATKKTTETA